MIIPINQLRHKYSHNFIFSLKNLKLLKIIWMRFIITCFHLLLIYLNTSFVNNEIQIFSTWETKNILLSPQPKFVFLQYFKDNNKVPKMILLFPSLLKDIIHIILNCFINQIMEHGHHGPLISGTYIFQSKSYYFVI